MLPGGKAVRAVKISRNLGEVRSASKFDLRIKCSDRPGRSASAIGHLPSPPPRMYFYSVLVAVLCAHCSLLTSHCCSKSMRCCPWALKAGEPERGNLGKAPLGP